MPVAGRKAKPASEAINRNRPVHDWIEVENTPHVGGPDLPEFRPDGSPWPARTVQKWDAWRTMPHCRLWGVAEWDFALDSIEVAAKFHSGKDVAATELRNREKVIGTTGDFLRDLRIRYVEPKQATLAVVVDADEFRDL